MDPVTAASSGSLAPLKRAELSGETRETAVESALADEQTEALFSEISSGRNQFETRQAEAYRITYTSNESAPITQVLIPVAGRDAKLGYARSDGEASVGLELEDGHVQSIDHPEKHGTVVQHKHVAEGQEKKEILRRVANEHALDNYDVAEAAVTVVEETDTAYAQIPVSDTGSAHADDLAAVAAVDRNNGDVTIQGGSRDCIISCLMTSTKFWGVCWSCCCQWCWNGLGCGACAGCVGITLTKCGWECAGSIF